jgi:hypothetical protein
MKSLLVVAVALALNSSNSFASVGKQVEMWCGTPTAGHSSVFPYMTSIRVFDSKKHHGKKFEVATIYKNGRLISKNYVYKTTQGMGMSYVSADNDFALNLPSHDSLDSTAAFRAVLHERDGDTLIANGEFMCHRPKASQKISKS